MLGTKRVVLAHRAAQTSQPLTSFGFSLNIRPLCGGLFPGGFGVGVVGTSGAHVAPEASTISTHGWPWIRMEARTMPKANILTAAAVPPTIVSRSEARLTRNRSDDPAVSARAFSEAIPQQPYQQRWDLRARSCGDVCARKPKIDCSKTNQFCRACHFFISIIAIFSRYTCACVPLPTWPVCVCNRPTRSLQLRLYSNKVCCLLSFT